MKKVLLVDDSPSFLKMTSRLVKRLGHKVFTAESSKLAVDKAMALSPHLILMDIDLQEGKTGDQIARELKDQNCPSIIVALTSFPKPSEEEISNSGFYDWITKSEAHLKDKIIGYLQISSEEVK